MVEEGTSVIDEVGEGVGTGLRDYEWSRVPLEFEGYL